MNPRNDRHVVFVAYIVSCIICLFLGYAVAHTPRHECPTWPREYNRGYEMALLLCKGCVQLHGTDCDPLALRLSPGGTK